MRSRGYSQLTNNAIVTWDPWASTFLEKKDWAGAIAIYDKALKAFPANGHLANNRKYAESQRSKP